jgi:hypothetical protein
VSRSSFLWTLALVAAALLVLAAINYATGRPVW